MSGLGTPAFRGTSRASVAELRGRLADVPRNSLAETGAELFAVTGLLDVQPALRRALTDPSRRAEDRAALANGVLDGRVGTATLGLVAAAVEQGWSRVRDLGDALEYLGVLAEVRLADEDGALDDLEDELFRFGRVVEGNVALQTALTDHGVPAERRADLAAELLAGKARDVTVRLVRQAVAAPRGQTLLDALAAYGEIAAAWRDRLVAIVRTAVALTDEEQARLTAILTRQYGREVHLEVLVDPRLVGGLRVEIGDEVVDGTLASRLDDTRRRLANR